MPAPGKSPIEGIMQALQAVHSYYGIDTEKQQQALLQTQNRKESAQATSAEEQAKSDQNAGKGLFDMYRAVKEGAYPTAGTLPTQVGTTAGAAPSSGGISPSGSSLLSAVQSQGAAPTGKQYGVVPVTNPTTGEVTNMVIPSQAKFQLEQEKGATDLAHVKQEMGIASETEKQKKQAIQNDYVKEFGTQTSGIQDAINNYKNIASSLTSGNPAEERFAKLKSALVNLGVKRANGELAELGDSQALVDQLENKGNQIMSGHASPKEIKDYIDLANSAQLQSAARLHEIANDKASTGEQLYGIPANQWLSKFLPNGDHTQVTKTELLPDKRYGQQNQGVGLYVNKGGSFVNALDSAAPTWKQDEVQSFKSSGSIPGSDLSKAGQGLQSALPKAQKIAVGAASNYVMEPLSAMGRKIKKMFSPEKAAELVTGE